jgi:hypothetical protein
MAAIAGWLVSTSIFFVFDIWAVLGMFIFFGTMTVPVGALLGLVISLWYSNSVTEQP